MTFALAARKFEHRKTREILCAHHPKTLDASTVRGCKIWKEWTQYL